MVQKIDQSINIQIIKDCLKSELRPDWDIQSNWRFGNRVVDIVAVHPIVGLAIFKVVTLPTEYSFEERDGFWKEDPLDNPKYEWDLLADPREEIKGWIEEAKTLIQSSLPNGYQKYISSGLIVFQTGEKAEINKNNLNKKFEKLIGKTKVRIEYITNVSDLKGVAIRLIPGDEDAATESLPNELWKKIQTEIMGDPVLILGELPPPMNDFDGEQIKFMQKVKFESLSRLRGPAGSGKSTVIARLAADTILQGKRVLLVTRNKTMATFLRSRIRCYVVDGCTSDEKYNLIKKSDLLATITHQEAWWRMVFESTGYLEMSNRCYARDIAAAEESKKPEDELAVEKNQLKLLKSAINRQNQFKQSASVYDLVVIDEAQNMLVENWDVLKNMARDNEAKVIVVADPTQSLYGQRPWTNKAMKGFIGPWPKLSGSHRLPSNCVELVHQFNKAFPSIGEVILPELPNELDFFPDAKLLRIVRHSHPDVIPADAVVDAVLYMRDHEGFAPYEIAFLVPGNSRGFMVVKRLLDRDPKIETTTSFNKETRHELGSGLGIRGSTVHSFAGWESPCVILDLDVWEGINDPNSVIYSALTRVRKRRAGSALVVIDGKNQYSNFFKLHTQLVEMKSS